MTHLHDPLARILARLEPCSIGLGLRLSLGSGGGGAPAPTPTTVNYTFAQVGGGWTLGTNSISNASFLFLAANSTANNAMTSIWVGWITGTSATATMNGGTTGRLEASIDGGAWTQPVPTGSVFPILAGASDTRHLVCLRIGAAYGTTLAAAPKTGNIMSVTGVTPLIEAVGNWVMPWDGNTNTISANAVKNNNTTNYAPAKMVENNNTGAGLGVLQNCPNIAVRGDYTTLVIAGTYRWCYVSIDGAAPTLYDRTTTTAAFGAQVVTGLSGTHTYTVWTSASSGQARWMSVGGILATGIVNITTKKCLDQFGDSISAGADLGTTYTDATTDTFIVGASLGYAPGNFGISGNVILDVKNRIDTILAEKTVTSSDVAVLAIGRNDNTGADTTWDATQISNYQYIVNALITKGYGLVLCRGCLTEGAQTYTNKNASLVAIVTGYASAAIKYINPATWTTITRTDGVHPTPAGYLQLAAYAQPAYVAAGA